MAAAWRWSVRGALVGAVCGAVLAAPPALAHTQLTGSTPDHGTTVAAPPSTVVLRFSEPVDAATGQIAVTHPDGTVTRPRTTMRGAAASAPFPPGSAGRYTVAYRVVSADGHPVAGIIAFTVTRSTTPTPGAPVAAPVSSPPTDASERHGTSVTTSDPVVDDAGLYTLAGLGVLVAVAGTVALRRRRRR